MDKRKQLEGAIEYMEANTKWSRARLGGGLLVHLMAGNGPYCGLVNTHNVNRRSRIHTTQDEATCIRCISGANTYGALIAKHLGIQPKKSAFVLDIANATQAE